jgi:hypothetical protein
MMRAFIVLAVVAVLADVTVAQQMTPPAGAGKQPHFHPLIPDSLPPGMTSAVRLMQGGCAAGYLQHVQIISEEPITVSVASEGRFTEPMASPTLLAMLIGPVYRLRITGIPGYEDRAVYPTIELVDRLYPPAGAEKKFPIPIELTADDLRLAAQGHFITRVVYLEDPEKALPGLSDPAHPSWFDAGPGAHPLVEAQGLGRPMAIVRLGGRIPDERNGPDMVFLNGCPPLKIYFAADAMPSSMPDAAVPIPTEQPSDAEPMAPEVNASPTEEAPPASEAPQLERIPPVTDDGVQT